MAPSIKRGKIKAQVFGDISDVVVSFATRTGETLGFIRNVGTTPTNGNNNSGGPDVGDGDSGGGGSSPPATNNNDR